MNDWYTYTLRREDGQVFYAGKGRGDYWIIHEQKARRGEKVRLTTIIQGIWDQGQQVYKQKEREGLSEEEAYAHQVELYNKYSSENPEMLYPGSYPRSIGHGKHIGESRKAKGYTHSQETLRKMAQTKTGKKYSKERLERNLPRLKNPVHLNTPEVRKKMAQTKTGSTYSEEAKAKMSASAKKRYARMTEEEKAAYLQEWIEAGQKASLRTTKDTTLELMVEETLKASGISYKKQFRVGIYTGDFYIPETNTIIEVNGCWMHRCPTCGWNNHKAEEIRTGDAKKLAYLQSKGYTVNVIWEHDIPGHRERKPKQ